MNIRRIEKFACLLDKFEILTGYFDNFAKI